MGTQLRIPQTGGKRKSTGDLEESEDMGRLKEEPEVTVKVTKSVGKFKFTSFKTAKQSEIKSDENNQTLQNTQVLAEKNNRVCDSQNRDNNVIKEEPPVELCKGHKRPCVQKTVS